MLKIGLTGGIGSGKSFVARIFHFLDIPIFYSDLAAKYIMISDQSLISSIKSLLGPNAYLEDGKLNKKYIASQIFENEEKLLELNKLVHPAVNQAANEWFEWQTTQYAIEESALIFESKFETMFDYIISVSAPIDLRIERVMSRDNISREDVLKRMDRQLSQEYKDKIADFIILNDGRNGILKQVLNIHYQLIQKSTLLL